MIRTLQIAAVILAVIAAYFMWIVNRDGVFVSVVLSGCSLFLSIRFQSKARLEKHKLENLNADNSKD